MPELPSTHRDALDRVRRAKERLAAAEAHADAAREELTRAEAALGAAVFDAAAPRDTVAATPPLPLEVDTVEPEPGPAGWRQRRTSTTWGVCLVAGVVSLLAQWIAQIAGGAVVGGIVGIEGIARLSLRDLETLAILNIASRVVFAAAAVGWTGLLAFERLSWPPADGRYGMNWWRYCFGPVLVLAAAHGVVFSAMFLGFAQS